MSLVHKIACTLEQKQKLKEKHNFGDWLFSSLRFPHNCSHLVRNMNTIFLECHVDYKMRYHGSSTDAEVRLLPSKASSSLVTAPFLPGCFIPSVPHLTPNSKSISCFKNCLALGACCWIHQCQAAPFLQSLKLSF